MSIFRNKIDIENGKIYSLKNENIEIAKGVDKDNYKHCVIEDNYGNKYYRVHDVIIAEALNLPKHLWPIDIKGKPYVVNHIKEGLENRTDNRIENLELISNNDNLRYGTRDKRAAEARINHADMSKPVYQYKNLELIAEYPSISEAARQTGFQLSKISQNCKGGYFDKRWNKWYETKTYKGYEFTHTKKEVNN